MKKVLFLSLAASAVLASCSNEVLDSVVPQEPQAISFDNAFIDNNTRAAITNQDVTIDNLTDFYVFGSKNSENLFTGEEKVNKSNGVWQYTNTKYWEKGVHYNFAAYSNGNATATTTSYDPVHNTLSINEFTNTGNSDLITAVGAKEYEGKASDNQQVEFTFNHILSKVIFTFNTTLTKTLTVKVNNLTITNALNHGSYNGTTWESVINAGTFAYNTPIALPTDTQAAIESEPRYMIPQTNKSLEATFTITADDDKAQLHKSQEFTVSLASGNTNLWEKGKVYNYTATITSKNIEGVEPIEFTVKAVDGWTSTDAIKPTLPQVQ